MTAILDNPVTMPEQETPTGFGIDKSFTSRQAPWFKLGPQIDGDVDSAEAAKLGGLDFEVELRPARFNAVTEQGNTTTVTVPNRKAIVRTDRYGVSSFIDFVSKDYEILQYAQAFAFMDAINPRYVSAGSLSDGRQGFIVAQLPEASAINLEINGEVDPHDLYVIVRTSHDRSKAIEISVMPLRHKCMNMLGLNSFNQGAPQRWSIKHIGDVDSKLAHAETVLKVTPKYAEIYAAKARQLASVAVSDELARSIVKKVLPARYKNIDDHVDAVMSTWKNDPTVGFLGNGWGLVNAVSTYYDWGRNEGTRTDQSMFTGALTGDSNKYMNRTAQLVMARA